MSKALGIEWKAYESSEDTAFWPEGSYVDDVLLIVDGQEWDENVEYDKIPDAAEVKVEAGVYYRSSNDDKGISLSTHFNRWRKAQTHETMVLQVPKDKAQAVKDLVASLLKGQP